jgi:uncharacterized surface protein with fasciclin (FAS1) repeats
MKKMNLLIVLLFTSTLFACNSAENNEAQNNNTEEIQSIGQSGVQDDASQKNVVQVAVSSKDHTTLVTAIKAGELMDALSNAGPFTVFAPTNEAFNKLPAGTVEGLLKPESKETLVDILQYHVAVGVYKLEALKEGQNIGHQNIGQVNGDNINITKKEGAYYVNGTAKIIASIPASNGIIHVIDGVLLPPKK